MNDDIDFLFDSLIDSIYAFTVEPVTMDKLEKHFEFFGHEESLKEISSRLGCHSFNHVIRRYREKFEPFLEIYTCPDGRLYYFNKHVRGTEFVLDDFEE